jgi:hypothetical protein
LLPAFGLAASKGAIQGNVAALKTQSKPPTPHVPEEIQEKKSAPRDEVSGELGGSTQPTLGKVQAELQVHFLLTTTKWIDDILDKLMI